MGGIGYLMDSAESFNYLRKVYRKTLLFGFKGIYKPFLRDLKMENAILHNSKPFYSESILKDPAPSFRHPLSIGVILVPSFSTGSHVIFYWTCKGFLACFLRKATVLSSGASTAYKTFSWAILTLFSLPMRGGGCLSMESAT